MASFNAGSPVYFEFERYRHAADKLQKTENVMEKYKKKLQEGADLRSHVKVSEPSQDKTSY